MSAIKLTSKRQATLPKTLCEEMGIHNGDTIQVEPATVKGKRVWVLVPPQTPTTPWFGCLRKYAKGKSHDMKAIRKSIERGWGSGGK
jgi:bifunctional DNA-binding transcriptional regulator/antitoxin component of YhaV-PrlF toxin-antitoxin module